MYLKITINIGITSYINPKPTKPSPNQLNKLCESLRGRQLLLLRLKLLEEMMFSSRRQINHKSATSWVASKPLRNICHLSGTQQKQQPVSAMKKNDNHRDEFMALW